MIVKLRLSGTETPVLAHKEPSAHNVLHAQLQEHGIQVQTNVFAHHQ